MFLSTPAEITSSLSVVDQHFGDFYRDPEETIDHFKALSFPDQCLALYLRAHLSFFLDSSGNTAPVGTG